MSTASEYVAPRSEAGRVISPNESVLGVPSKTFVVGQFDEFGRARSKGEFIGGTAEAIKYRNRLLQDMGNKGNLMPGFVMTNIGPVKQSELPKPPQAEKRGRGKTPKPVKAKPVIQVPDPLQEAPEPVVAIEETYTAPRKTPKFSVVFSVGHGKIKSTADAVLENDDALLVVYADEDAISYVPEKGSLLTLTTPDRRDIEVMYLGLQFEWHESRQQLMVFMKTPKEE